MRSCEYFSAASKAPCAIARCLRRNADAAAVQRGQRGLVAFAFVSDPACCRHFAIREGRVRCTPLALIPVFFLPCLLETWRAFFHYQRGNALFALAGSVLTYTIAASAAPPLVIHAFRAIDH